MADEPAAPQVPETPAPAVDIPAEPAAAAPVAQPDELSQLREKHAKLESIVYSPEYAEFLRWKSGAARPSEPAKPPSREEREAVLAELEKMDRVQLATHIASAVISRVREEMFTPLVNTMVSRDVQNQIASAQTKYPDFMNYREQMIPISNANPNLTAEQVYLLAKGTASAAPTPATPARPRRPSGEIPGGTPAVPRTPDKPTLEQAFDIAAKKAGLTF